MDKITDKIFEFFDNGVKNLFLTINTDCKSLCTDFEKHFKNVLYFDCDRDRYINKNIYSIDTLLKKSLVTPYISCNEPDFCDYLEKFETSLDKDTLVILDGYDIPSPSPYLRHLMKSDCSLLVVGKSLFSGISTSDKNIVFEIDDSIDIDCLTDSQKELVMTLSAILYYLPENIKIDRETLSVLVPVLSENLDDIITKGFVFESCDGALCMKRNHIKQILEKYNPTSDNCPAFMGFLNNALSFTINQRAKNNLSMLVCDEQYTKVSRELLYSAYTHFSLADTSKGIKIYNLLMSMTLENKSFLKLKNKEYYLAELKKYMDNDLCEVLYNDYFDDEKDNYFSFSPFVKSRLDLLRISVCFLSDITGDLYKENMPVFEILNDCFLELLAETEKISDFSKRISILDEAIKLSSRLFDYCDALDDSGNYNKSRDGIPTISHRFLGEHICDETYATGVYMAFSIKTIKLYASYQKILDTYISLAENLPDGVNMNFLPNISYRREVSKRISRTFCRISVTYAEFFDFNSGKYEKVKLYKIKLDEKLEKKILENKRYQKRGFDGGTNKGAERYAKSIMKTLETTSRPLFYLRFVLDRSFFVSDECYRQLVKQGFIAFFHKTSKIPDREKMYFASELCDNLSLLEENSSLADIYRRLIAYVVNNMVVPESIKNILFDSLSPMYLECYLNGKGMDFAEHLFEKLSFPENKTDKSCTVYLAKMLYAKRKNININPDKNKLSEAVNLYKKERILSGYEQDENLFLKLSDF